MNISISLYQGWLRSFMRLLYILLPIILFSTGCGESATHSEDGEQVREVEYEVIWDQPISADIVSEAGDQLPEEVLDWVAGEYQQEYEGSLEIDGQTYILIARGEQSSSGYQVEVDNVSAVGDTLQVEGSYIDPANDEINLTVMTYPLVVLKVDGTYAEIEFEVMTN